MEKIAAKRLEGLVSGNGSRENPYTSRESGYLAMVEAIAQQRGEILGYGHTIFITIGSCTFSIAKEYRKFKPGPVNVSIFSIDRSKRFNADDVGFIADQVNDLTNSFSPSLEE